MPLAFLFLQLADYRLCEPILIVSPFISISVSICISIYLLLFLFLWGWISGYVSPEVVLFATDQPQFGMFVSSEIHTFGSLPI